jgi:hypothetical protein
MKLKNPPWPLELRTPIVVEEIKKGIPPQQRMKHLQTEITIAIYSERERRLETIADFLNRPYPTNDEEWLRLLIALCRFWEIPAFDIAMVKPRGPGATRIWTDQKHCQLFADVQSVVAKGLSETAACRFIASNSKQFGFRYNLPKRATVDGWKKTLNRQYVTAKNKITSNQTFRTLYFSDDTGTDVPYGPEFIARAIKQYAYARESSSGKFA